MAVDDDIGNASHRTQSEEAAQREPSLLQECFISTSTGYCPFVCFQCLLFGIEFNPNLNHLNHHNHCSVEKIGMEIELELA